MTSFSSANILTNIKQQPLYDAVCVCDISRLEYMINEIYLLLTSEIRFGQQQQQAARCAVLISYFTSLVRNQYSTDIEYVVVLTETYILFGKLC